VAKKQSYMSNNTILAEGFFGKIAKLLKLSSSEENKLKKNKKLKSSLKKYNDGWKSIEQDVRDATGDENFKLPHQKFTLSDFL